VEANGAYAYHGLFNGALDMRNAYGYELWKFVSPAATLSFWAITRSSDDLAGMEQRPMSWLYESAAVSAGSAQPPATDFARLALPAAWSVQKAGMGPAPIVSSVPCPVIWVCGAAAAGVNGRYAMSGGARNGAAQFDNKEGARVWKVVTNAAGAGAAAQAGSWWAVTTIDASGAQIQIYASAIGPASATLPPSSATETWASLAGTAGKAPTVRVGGTGCE